MVAFLCLIAAFFTVEQRQGGEYVVMDPDGRRFVPLGVDHVRYRGNWCERTNGSEYFENNKRRCRSEGVWASETLGRLKYWGFNLLGSGCQTYFRTNDIAYTEFLAMGELAAKSGFPELALSQYRGCPGSAFPNVFSKAFERHCEKIAAEKCSKLRNEAKLFGYFIDNELNWDACATKGAAYVQAAAERYFLVTTSAIRRYDPNHLILGCRFAGFERAPDEVWRAAGRHCDVVSLNCYPWVDLVRREVRLSRVVGSRSLFDALWDRHRLCARPLMITEWSFPALDSGLPCLYGAGQRFLDQSSRAEASALFARTLLSMPFVVGYDYFMWVDEPREGMSDAFPEDSNYGLVNLKGEPYAELVSALLAVHRDAREGRAGMKASVSKEGRRQRSMPNMPTAIDLVTSLCAGKSADAPVWRQDGSRYEVSWGDGRSFWGELQGCRPVRCFSVKGEKIGGLSAMLRLVKDDGTARWAEVQRVSSAEWSILGRVGILDAKCEWTDGGASFDADLRFRVIPGIRGIVVSLVRVTNKGREPLVCKEFYFRQYPFFQTDGKRHHVRFLAEKPVCDEWRSVNGKSWWKGSSKSGLAVDFNYHSAENGTCFYPDAKFVLSPDGDVVLGVGEIHEAKETIWMLAEGGFR